MLLDDAYLLGNHVELLTRLDADLNQRMAVMLAEELQFR
jgi:hypothetical protein